LNLPAASGETLINLAGGGTTQVQQAGGMLRLKSYNFRTQRLHGRWVYLNEKLLPRILTWPPPGTDDPTFAFASANWPKIIAASLAGARALGNRRIGGVLVGGYELHLSLFKTAPGASAGPRLVCWIDHDGQLRVISLRWPLHESRSPGNGDQGSIVITLRLYDFRR
jgi:hypothetical protein